MDIKKRVISLLQKLNLTENEAKFYIMANQNADLTLPQIQSKLSLSKATVYRIYEKLKSLGFITSSPENWRKNINAVSLRTLADLIAGENRKLRRIELELKDLDNFMDMDARAFSEDPIKILYDKNQIAEHNFNILHKSWDRLLVLGSCERLMDVVGKENEQKFVQIRTRMGRPVSLYLTEYGNYASEFMPNNDEELRNVKLRINPTWQDHLSYLYGDEVTIWNKDKDLGNRAIVINDPLLVNMYRSQFDTAWSGS
jgi:predicted DNA-binding transcriptional regulator AlpA